MIYVCDDFNERTNFEVLEKLATNERIGKAKRFLKRIDYGTSLLAFALLQFGLQKECGAMLSKQDKFNIDDNGKPHLRNSGLNFNLSHCENCVACIISKDKVGIDVQHYVEISNSMVDFAMSNNEQVEIAKDRRKFFEFWTQKEAYFKLLGTGISKSMKDCDFANLKNNNYIFDDCNFVVEQQNEYVLSACSQNVSDLQIVKLKFSEIQQFIKEYNNE